MYFQSAFLVILLLHSSTLACVRVVILLEFICFPDVLELIGLESMHDLLADSIRLQIHLHISFNHCSKPVAFRSFLGSLDLHLILSFFFLLFVFLFLLLFLLAGRHLESHLNFLLDTLLESINNFIDMHFGFGFVQRVFFIGKGSLSIDGILLGGNAFVLDQIAHSDNHLDCLNSSEENQQPQRHKELYQ